MSHRPRMVVVALTALAILTPATAQAFDSLQPGTTALLGGSPGLGTLPDDSSNYSATSGESVSKDGRYVVFTSEADGMAPDDDNAYSNIFVRDTQTGTTTLVSRLSGTNGAPFDNDSFGAVISGDGHKVAFSSYATNAGGGGQQVYERDLVNNTTALVSCAGNPCVAGGGGNASISNDGSYVAFESSGGTLAPDTNSTTDIFIRNMANTTPVLVSRTTGINGTQVAQASRNPSISDDGKRVAFECDGALNVNDANNQVDVYLRDTNGNQTLWVSNVNGHTGGSDPALAGDGGEVAFATQTAYDTVKDTNAKSDVYLWPANAPANTALISRSTGAGTNAGNGGSYGPAINTNGTVVAFESSATDLGDGDTNNTFDIHLRSGTTTSLVSRATGANGAVANARSTRVSLDDTGVRAVFQSTANNLVPSVGSGDQDRVYVRATGTASTTVASLPTGPDTFSWPISVGSDSLGTNFYYTAESTGSALSDDGRYLAFSSTSDALLDSDDDSVSNVYVRDLVTGRLTLVSQATDGTPANNLNYDATISGDGTHVAWVSLATNLVPGAGPYSMAVFVRDLVHNTTVLASRRGGPAGAPDTSASGTALSRDGTKVAFLASEQLDPKDANGSYDVYVRDIVNGTTTLASRKDGAGTDAPAQGAYMAAINGDGTKVAFLTQSPDLGDGDTDGFANVHLRDLVNNTTTLVDRADGAQGAQANSNAFAISIDRSGNRVGFLSMASNLATTTPNTTQTFVRDIPTATTILISRANGDGVAASNDSGEVRISGDGRRVAFQAVADNLIEGSATKVRGVWIRDIATKTTTLVSRKDGADGAAAVDGFNPSLDDAGDCVAFITHDLLTTPSFGSMDYGHVHLRVLSGECPHIAPDTKIDIGASGTITTATPAIAFSADEGGATFACQIDGGAFAACASPLTTPKLANGPHTFAVRATDRAGLVDGSPATAAFTVAVPGPTDKTPPVLSALALAPARFAVASGPTAAAARKREPAHRGTSIGYTLSEPAKTTLTFLRLKPGRRSGKRCVAPKQAARGAKRCTRRIPVGSLARTTAAGAAKIAFTGRIGTKKLAIGSYLLKARATDAAGNRSKTITTTLKVVHA